MRHASLLLLAVLLSINNACAIQGYSPSDPVSVPSTVQDKIQSLSFSYITSDSIALASGDRTLPWESQTIKELFEGHSRFSKVIVTSSPPQDGMHINVYQTDGPLPSWCRASIWTLTLIPCYADGVVHTMHFDVFLNSTLKESYQYDITRKGVQWLGLLPFFLGEFLHCPV